VRLRHPILALLAGAATVLGFAPFQLFPLPLASLALLFGLLAGRRHAGEGFAIGLAWGLGFFVAGVSWLYVALNRFGGMPGPIAAAAIFLFALYLALWPAMASALFVKLRSGRAGRDALMAGGVWMGFEWLRGWVLTGFPWLSIAYSQTPPSPLAGYFPYLGVFGTGALLVALAAGLGSMLRKGAGRLGPWVVAAVVVVVAGAALREQTFTEPSGEPLKVALVQTNIQQDLKWQPQRLRDWLDLNLQLVRAHPAALVVLPESTLPMLAEQLPGDYLARLATAAGPGGTVIAGVFTRDQDHIYNSALGLSGQQRQSYAKHHLVPFGEYSPPTFGWFYRLANIPLSDQTPGAPDQPLMTVGDQRLALNICYEDVFGDEIRRRAGEATILVNLSNLAWYGDSFAQPQHLQMARVRAIETGRPMLRSTNTGMTAAIGPDGRVTDVLPAFTRDVLEVSVQGMSGETPYLRWGDRLAFALGAVMVLPALWRRWRRR